MPAPHNSIFTGRVFFFLALNQQYQNTEGNNVEFRLVKIENKQH